MSRTAIGLYVALALLVSWTLQILAIGVWGLDAEPTRAVFVGVMWSPTLIALAFIVAMPAARAGLRWRPGRLGYLPLGIAVETATAFAVVAALVGTGLATSGYFLFGPAGVTVSGGPWLLGGGAQGWPLFLMNVALTAVAYSALSLVATVGEEFAWRGFLQGHLTRLHGVRPGILAIAAIWWAWHLPGLLAGYNFPHYPYVGAFILFPLQMIGASFFFGWLTIRAGSFWPAALAHGAVNSIQQGVIDNLQLRTPMITVDLLRTGLVLAVGLICWWALRNDDRRVEPV
jgi:uncharacterized protein